MADLATLLIPRYFPISGDQLVAGGTPVPQLAELYGTPLFIYDGEVLDRKFAALRSALPSRFEIYYSLKANPNQTVARHFLKKGAGLEIASGGEYRRARNAGCRTDKIIFAGPGKTQPELELVLSQGIGEIHVESLVEAERITAICRRLGRRARVSIRINPAGEAQGGAMRMGGKAAPFGVDEECLDEVLDSILAQPELDLGGIHLFTGTQILDASVLLHQYRHGLGLARRVADRLGRSLRTIDFGGGLGVPYFGHEQELDLEALRTGLIELCKEADSGARLAEAVFVVEPGRFLTAEAGLYVTRINDIKTSRGKKFLITDGGMNHHLAASGNLGQTIKRNYPIALANKLRAPVEESVDIAGPLCTPLDTLARGILLPQAAIGDLVVIFQSGAYGPTASPQGFLSHPPPREVWVDAGHSEHLDEGSEAHEPSLQDEPSFRLLTRTK